MLSLRRFSLLVVGVLLASAAAAQDPYPGLRPLAAVLHPDGTLAPGAHGSLDARGYRLATTETGAPRFVAATDGAWDDRFGLPGLSFSEVHALLAHEGDLYAAGWFSDAGGVPMRNVARWDGRRWHALGEGVEGTAYALAWYAGELYVGGRIEKAGAVLASGIARWDGTAWKTVGDGLVGRYGDPHVYSLAVYQGALYVGGEFGEAGGVEVAGLARWDGAQWSAPGTPTTGEYGEPGSVYAMAADATHLYVGGHFDAVSGVAAEAVARYDGTTWAALGGGVLEHALFPKVRALALQADQLFVGGTFERAAGKAARNVAVWNRATQAWSGLGQGVRGEFSEGEVRALLPVGTTLYAAGDFAFAGAAAAGHVARWDGTAWSALSQQAHRGLDVAATSLVRGPDGSVYVGGTFEQAGGLSVNRVARWDGARFRTLGEGVHFGRTDPAFVYGVATSADGKVYVAGQFHYAGSAVAENVAMWDGTEWHALGSGTDGIVFTVATRGDDVFIGGRFTEAGGVAARHIARWNAPTQTWHALGSGTNGYVWDIATDDQWVYAAGDFTAAGGVAAEDVARWDGTAWSTLGTGIHFNPNGTVYAILLDGDYVWIGGDFLSVIAGTGYPTVNSLLTWKQSTDEWFEVGGGVTRKASSDVWGTVYALEKLNGEIYVGGRFDKAGQVGASAIARWDGTRWAALGSAVGGESTQEVQAMVAYGTDLYVTGQFTTAGGEATRAVARWNATTQSWAGLEGGLGGGDFVKGFSIARHAQDVYVGGYFLTAAGAPSSSFARWHVTGTPPPPQATIRVDPARVDFTELVAGRVAEAVVTITNVSSGAPLTGTVGALAAPFSVVSGGGAFTLAPGAARSVTVRFAPTAAGDVSAALVIMHDGANTASPLRVPITGRGASAVQTIAIRTFDPQSQQFFGQANGDFQTYGFVFGTNAYLDRQKAMGFPLPTGLSGGHLTEVKAWFIYKKPGLDERPYTLRVYDGSMLSGPATLLYSKTYRLADIAADDLFSTASGPTTYGFDVPVPVGQTFFVSFDFGEYTAQEAVMVSLSNTARLDRRVPEVWEQWSNGQWANMSDAWTGSDGAPGTGTGGWYPWIEATVVTGTPTSDAPLEVPATTTLAPNAPNPFGGRTTLAFALAEAGPVRLVVHDLVGREVAVVVDEVRPAGHHAVPFEAGVLPSGLYFYTLHAGGQAQTRQMMLVR